MHRLFAAAGLALSIVGSACAQGWSLVQSTGDVQIEQPGLAPAALRPQEKLAPGTTITTGASGQAVLSDGRSSINVKPQSRIVLPASSSDGMTHIRQDFGSAFFKVQKKPAAHFEVQTPYMAAVVKGTSFDVGVDSFGAGVAVDSGLVEVVASREGEMRPLRAGERARVRRDGRFEQAPPRDATQSFRGSAYQTVIAFEITPEEAGPDSRSQDLNPERTPMRNGQTAAAAASATMAAQTTADRDAVGEGPRAESREARRTAWREARREARRRDRDRPDGDGDGRPGGGGGGPGRGDGGPGGGDDDGRGPGRGDDHDRGPGRGDDDDHGPGRGDDGGPGRGDDDDDDDDGDDGDDGDD